MTTVLTGKMNNAPGKLGWGLLAVSTVLLFGMLIHSAVFPDAAIETTAADAHVFGEATMEYGADTQLLVTHFQQGAGEQVDQVALRTADGTYISSAPVPTGTSAVQLDTYESSGPYEIVALNDGEVVETMGVSFEPTPVWSSEHSHRYSLPLTVTGGILA